MDQSVLGVLVFANAAAATFTINGGGHDPSYPGLEANVDTQYAWLISYPTQLFYSTGGRLKWPPTANRPQGTPTSNNSTILNMRRPCASCWLGVRGVSVLVTSCDGAVGSGKCRDSSGNDLFVPTFPTSCPWATSVGGMISHDPRGRDTPLQGRLLALLSGPELNGQRGVHLPRQ